MSQTVPETQVTIHGGPDIASKNGVSVTTWDLGSTAAMDGLAAAEVAAMTARLAAIGANPLLGAAGLLDLAGMGRVIDQFARASAGPAGTLSSSSQLARHSTDLGSVAAAYELSEGRVTQLFVQFQDIVQDKRNGLPNPIELVHDVGNVWIEAAISHEADRWLHGGIPTKLPPNDLSKAFASDSARQQRILAQIGWTVNGLPLFSDANGETAAGTITDVLTKAGLVKPMTTTLAGRRLTDQPVRSADTWQHLISGLDRASQTPEPGAADQYTQAASVQINTVVKNGVTSYVVYLPPTQEQDFDPTHPTNFTTDLLLGAGRPNAAIDMATMAMAAKGIPPGAPVMLVGYSQGGLAAARLAADPAFRQQYNVKAVMTTGSPIATVLPKVPESIAVMAFEGDGDPIPTLDGARNPTTANHITVTYKNPAIGSVERHDYAIQKQAVLGTQGNQAPALRQFAEATQDFTGSDANVTADEYTFASK